MKAKNQKHSRNWWHKHFPSAFWQSKDGYIYIDEIIVYYSFN